jgi:ubiquinone/menaquinone biosynthesis C-methylase UbiE
MTELDRALSAQYAPTDISVRIVARLIEAGIDPERLTREDLASFDEFHAGGRESTRELARLARAAGIADGAKVLDIGCGIGGPARTLAAEFACQVIGIDLTEGYCQAARMLTTKLGMDEQLSFHCANALELPFTAASFDMVWSQNVWMNIDDKARFMREVVRVLRPGGVFALETILAGAVPGMHLPVLWADSPAVNFLVNEAEAKALLLDAGLKERVWQDTTPRSIALQRKRQQINERDGPPLLSLNVLVPTDFRAKVENVLRNNLEGHTRTVQAIYCK